MTFESWFVARFPEIPAASALAVLKLAEDGGTVPFIARYRKEATGNLDEVAIQTVLDAKETWDEILKRQAFIGEEIGKQGKLTPELSEKLLSTFDLDALEDLYLPFKKKRKTKAVIAREAGLAPVANWVWDVAHGTLVPAPGETLSSIALRHLNPEAGFADEAAVLAGATDILVERLSENEELRQYVRNESFTRGAVRSAPGEKVKPNSKFEMYFAFEEPVPSLLKPENSHRYLALRRGWLEGELTASVGGRTADPAFDERLLAAFELASAAGKESPGQTLLKKASRLALKAHVFPSIETEVHKALKDSADAAAIQVFAENVKKVLLAAPFGPKAVLAIDPGIRTGCKLALVDDSGRFIESGVIYLHDEGAKKRAAEALLRMLQNGNVRAIAIGNGTAGRETEAFVKKAIRQAGFNTPVVLVSEAGASVYSASEIAREEFPDLDLTVRGAISIARRVQDPLAELVKVDPKSIGVGQYQHDVSQPALKKRLDLVVDSAVNQVGVNLNTASSHLLAHVSGIGPALAKSIVSHREKKGLFRSRRELLEVPRFTKKTFEQAAGFLRVPGGEHPLDATGIHPEKYEVLEEVAIRLGVEVGNLLGPSGAKRLREVPQLREQIGSFTFDDILEELAKPGRDPRETFVPFQYRDDILEISDLAPGMLCPGIVTNVTNFGAFVDIGVHQDGLVHISRLADHFVREPRDVVNPGDRVYVKVLAISLEKRQISLTMRLDDPVPAGPVQKPEARERAVRA
ncbi:MAG: RNA-binding transcriptional accessory protein [Thermoanaerobaculia bacterium]|nr:RNA-binding transcriptional accessory protein [Thermoanaerobaculia bacterium]